MQLNQKLFHHIFFFHFINYKQSAIIFLARHELHSRSLGMSQLFLEFGFSAFLDTWAAVRRRLAKIPIVLSQTKTKASNWRFWLDGWKKGEGKDGAISSSGVVGGKVGRKKIFMLFSQRVLLVFLSDAMQIRFQDYRGWFDENLCALLIWEQIILMHNNREICLHIFFLFTYFILFFKITGTYWFYTFELVLFS